MLEKPKQFLISWAINKPTEVVLKKKEKRIQGTKQKCKFTRNAMSHDGAIKNAFLLTSKENKQD